MPSKSAQITGLTIPPGRVNGIIEKNRVSARKSATVKVSIAAATEALLTLLLNNTVERCKEAGVQSIRRDDIKQAIIETPSLGEIFKEGCFVSVPPPEYISPALIPSKKNRKSKKKKAITVGAEIANGTKKNKKD
jgi:histone H3/H4